MFIPRDIYGSLLEWRRNAVGSPLVVLGARGVGKSTAVSGFGNRHFRHVAHFSFSRQRELHSLFTPPVSPIRILSNLPIFADVPITKGDTLLFFDDIHECIPALASLARFADEASGFRVIAAGSLTEQALADRRNSLFSAADFQAACSSGSLACLRLYPLTFREFLRACEPHLFRQADALIRSSVRFDGQSLSPLAAEPLPELLFANLSDVFRRYMVCGGMPKPCSDMLDGAGMESVASDLTDIRHAFEFDFTRFVASKDIPRLFEIWQSIPTQLSRANRKFFFKSLGSNARARKYQSALRWLADSRMVHSVALTADPLHPSAEADDADSFKLYPADPALLLSLSELPLSALTARGNLLREFKAAMAETSVLNSLLAQGYPLPHYWTRSGTKSEIPFLIQHGADIIPLDLSPDTAISGQNLRVYQQLYSPQLRLRLSLQNISLTGNTLNLPLFACDWLSALLPTCIESNTERINTNPWDELSGIDALPGRQYRAKR